MVQYINKDTLVAEIEKTINKPYPKHDQQCSWEDGYCGGLYKALSIIEDTLEVKEVDLEKRTKILADIIFDAAKHGYMPYDTQDEHCAMEKARRNIIKLI